MDPRMMTVVSQQTSYLIAFMKEEKQPDKLKHVKPAIKKLLQAKE